MYRALAAILIMPAFLMFTQEPIIQRSTILLSTVKRGDVVQMVRGLGELKARRLVEIKIPTMYAQDIKPGQKAIADTRNGILPAKVSRLTNVIPGKTTQVELQLDH